MTSKPKPLWMLLWPLSMAPAYSAGIQNLTFAEVVKDVMVINVATKQESPAKAGDVLVAPNVLKTGPDSRAELVAEDKTITRVGANTIFSVEADSRDVNLAQGSVLLSSPKGKGGGRIKSAGATASVLGTTIQVGANSGAGGMKVMVMEGKAALAGAKGGATTMMPGQLSFVQAGKPPTAPLNFDLKANISANKLVGGFSKPLASIAKIEAAASTQQSKIAKGQLASTGRVIQDRPESAFFGSAELIQQVQGAIASAITATIQVIALRQLEADAETRTASRNTVDPRFVEAVKNTLSLSGNIAPEMLLFSMDGSGVSPEGYAVPKSIPGDRSSSEGTIAALISKDIFLTLGAVDGPDGTKIPDFLYSPKTMDKDKGAIVALNDLNLSGSIDLTGFEAVRAFPSLSGGMVTSQTQVTVPNVTIYQEGMDYIGDGIPTGTKIISINAATKTLTLSQPTAQSTQVTLPSTAGLSEGMFLTGEGVPAGTKIDSIDRAHNILTVSKSITAPATDLELFVLVSGVATVQGSNEVTVSSASSMGLSVGMIMTGDAFASGTTITDISSDGTTITVSSQATQTGTSDLTLLGYQSGVPLVLSAGHQFVLNPGSLLRADTSLLEIYAAGTSFSEDKRLEEQLAAVKAPLVLDTAAIVNEWSNVTTGDEAGKMTGTIRIKAPSIEVIDSKIMSGRVYLEADGRVSVSSRGYESIDAMKTAGRLVPLGITDISQLAIKAYTVGITSNLSSVSLENITFEATNATLTAGDQLTLSGVTYNSMNESDAEQSLRLTARNDVTIRDSSFTYLVRTDITSSQGDVKITGSGGVPEMGFGSKLYEDLSLISDNTPARTSFAATAAKAMLLENLPIHADTVNLTSTENLTVQSVGSIISTIAPTDTPTNRFTATSLFGNAVMKNLLIQHGIVKITAGGDIPGALPSGISPVLNEAKAAEINLLNVTFSNATSVSLDAATIVLKDVSFKADSRVTLNSFHGQVAARPGTDQTVSKGYVNFVKNVYHGATEVKIDNSLSQTPMNNTQFQAAATAAGKDLSKITIGTQRGGR